jgi:neutral ceramidase
MSRLGLALIGVLTASPLFADGWTVGIAREVITPREAVWLSGYGGRTKPAEGKIHDLWAKAFAFGDEEGLKLVLVCCDLGSMDQSLRDAAAAAALREHGVDPQTVLINVSHTHCAPEIAKERPVFHNLSEAEESKLARYITDELQPALVRVIGRAVADRQPARLTFSQSAAEFAFNRRFPTDGGFVNQPYDAGVTDHDVPVLQVHTPDGRLRGVLFGYACHNTTLAFYQYCGDYAGFAQEFVEAAHPGVTAGFVMGCGGDQNPYPRHGDQGLEHCRRHGRSLADAVQLALGATPVTLQPPLRVARETVTLDLEPLPPREQLERDAQEGSSYAQRKARHLLQRLDREGTIELTQTCPLLAAQFGRELLFLAIGGETVVDYSRLSKAEFAGPAVWVAGYNDDVFAYLPSRRVLLEGGYEGRTGIVHQLVPTPFLPSVEDRVRGGLRRLVRQVEQP